MKGEKLDKHADRQYIYTILRWNLPFKKADWMAIRFDFIGYVNSLIYETVILRVFVRIQGVWRQHITPWNC